MTCREWADHDPLLDIPPVEARDVAGVDEYLRDTPRLALTMIALMEKFAETRGGMHAPQHTTSA